MFSFPDVCVVVGPVRHDPAAAAGAIGGLSGGGTKISGKSISPSFSLIRSSGLTNISGSGCLISS